MTTHPEDHVEAIASTPVLTLQGRVTLREAARRLTDAHVGALVVTEGPHRPVAIISERDVVRALADGADPDEVWAADVMTEEPRYVAPGQSIRTAGEEMLATGVRHLPVVDGDVVVGMIAERDVLAVMAAAAMDNPTATEHPPVERELSHPGG